MHIKKFEASWCNPCKMLTRVIDEAGPIMPVITYDIDESSTIAVMYKIRTVPTLVLMDANNNELDRRTGSMSVSEYTKWLSSFSN